MKDPRDFDIAWLINKNFKASLFQRIDLVINDIHCIHSMSRTMIVNFQGKMQVLKQARKPSRV